MTDPYSVLGVSRDASDDEIKKAYRTLARKYHPDKYVGSPLADSASEKMKEVNQAYDAIMEERKGGGTSSRSGYGRSAGTGGYQTYGPFGGFGGFGGAAGGNYGDADYSGDDPLYRQAAAYIRAGQLDEAQALLQSRPGARRDAEWYYLMGQVLARKGWTQDARGHFETAVRMDPNNFRYQQAYNRVNHMGASYGGYQTGNGMGGFTCCDVCSSLICADCCCECMGGDLISCC